MNVTSHRNYRPLTGVVHIGNDESKPVCGVMSGKRHNITRYMKTDKAVTCERCLKMQETK